MIILFAPSLCQNSTVLWLAVLAWCLYGWEYQAESPLWSEYSWIGYDDPVNTGFNGFLKEGRGLAYAVIMGDDIHGEISPLPCS